MNDFTQYRVFIPTTKECYDDWEENAFQAWEDAGKPPTCLIMKMDKHGWKPISDLNMEGKKIKPKQRNK